MTKIDVAIIGGGPAGLTAAATLARQLHTAVVFDSGSYRNASSHHLHTVPGWDHKDPKEFRETSRQQILENYETIQFSDVAVKSVSKKSDSSFEIKDNGGKSWEAAKLILAVGCSNVFPDIEGYAECWGSKLYHCLFCLGYEDRGAESVAVLAVQASAMVPAIALHQADNAAQLAKEVTIFTNGGESVASQLNDMAEKTLFKIDNRTITKLLKNEDGVTMQFGDGTTKKVAFVVHNPLSAPQGPFKDQLGLDLNQMGDIEAQPPAYQTNVKGVFAAGDCITPFKVAPHAIMSGNFAAVAAATQLQAEKYGHTSII